MVQVEQLAQAAMAGDALRLRSLTQDLLRQHTRLADAARPSSSDPTVSIVAAGLIELLSERRSEPAPAWTREIGPAHPPIYLVRSSEKMPRLRRLCETESPEPLRRRNLFVPPTFLQFA